MFSLKKTKTAQEMGTHVFEVLEMKIINHSTRKCWQVQTAYKIRDEQTMPTNSKTRTVDV